MKKEKKESGLRRFIREQRNTATNQALPLIPFFGRKVITTRRSMLSQATNTLPLEHRCRKDRILPLSCLLA